MPPASFVLLLTAAVLHAVSNLLLKQARDKQAFVWWGMALSSVVGLPLLLAVNNPHPAGWIAVAASGVLEAVYFTALGRAYSLGDLSQVYPLARGSAPLFVTLWAFLLLRERPSPLGLLGIVSIVIGLYVVNLTALADWKRPLLGLSQPVTRWALLTGLFISGYSTVDKVGVEYFNPVIYLFLVLWVCWLVLTPQWLRRGRRSALLAEVGPDREACGAWRPWRRAGAVAASALFGFTAYVLVLTAVRISPVSYVSASREMSVVIAAWIGVKFLREPGGAPRILAAGLVAAGIFLIALGGGSFALQRSG